MTERAAHLVDHVLPDVPVRQWVLSVPYRLRYLLAWNHDLCRAMAAILARSVFRVLADRARDAGVENTRGGAVVVIQRFGGALNLNVHFHALVLDGVFASGDAADPEFHPTRRLTALDVAEVLAAVEALVARRLRRMGQADSADAEEGAAEPFGDGLSSLAAAAVEGRVALGRRPGTRVTRTGLSRVPRDIATAGRCHAVSHGYSLHAGLVVPSGQRARLERVCRYALRPPVAADRISLTSGGQVRLRLRQPWREGTTGFVFDPVDFLGRLAVLAFGRAQATPSGVEGWCRGHA